MLPFFAHLHRYWFTLLTLIYLFSGCYLSVWAQNTTTTLPYQQSGNFIFDNLEWGDGISNPFIPSIYQDQQGFLWFSTKEALVRYDGLHLKTYTHHPADSNSISNSFTWHITQDHEGIMWIPTHGGGLNRFDPISEKFSVFPIGGKKGLSAGVIWTVREDSQHRLWVGTRGEGLFIISADRDPDATMHFPNQADNALSISGNNIGRCMEDREGRFWVPAEGGGLNLFDPETGQSHRFSYRDGSNKGLASSALVYDVVEDTMGKIWVPSFNGLSLLDMEDTTFTHFFHQEEDLNSLSHNEIWHVTVDRQNRIWLPTRNGFNMLDPATGQFVHFFSDPLNPHSILHDFAYTSYEDREEIIWVGTANGVSKLNPSNFSFIPLVRTLEEKKNSNFEGGFWELLSEQNGTIRATSGNAGSYIYDLKTNTYHQLSPDPRDRYFYFPTKVDLQGRIWLRKHSQLFYQYLDEEDTWPVYQAPPALNEVASNVSTLTVDSAGYLWAGNGPYLYKINPVSLELEKRFRLPEETGKPMLLSIRFIKIDQFNNFWLGGEGGGLYHFNTRTEKFSPLVSDLDIPLILDPSLGANGYLIDSKGWVWIYTKDRLMRFKPTRAGMATDLAQWPSNGGRFHEDQLNRYWLVTKDAITAFTPEGGMEKTYSLKGITERLDRSLVSTANGDLYLGGFQGLYSFNPEQFKSNSLAPPVVLTDFKLSGQSLPVRGSYGDTLFRPSQLDTAIQFDQLVELAHDQNDLTIEFAALSFIQPQLNQYKYLLEGYSRDTIHTTATLPIAPFTGVPPGHYTFRVWASNSDGIWNRKGVSLQIRIYPPWYWSWWSKALYLLLSLSIIYTFYQFQLKRRLAHAEADRLRELDTAKTQLYTNITHEFRTPLTIILGVAEQLQNQVSEHARQSLQLVNRNGRQLLRLINEMLNLSKLESGHLKLQPEQRDIIGYLRYLVESFHSQAELKQIRLHFMSEIRECYMDFDPKQLMHVVTNLLSNAIKFTPEGKDVYLLVKMILGDDPEISKKRPGPINTKEQLLITVKDTGVGIPEEKFVRIFDRFYQLDNSDTRSGEGTGIGLTLAKELVQMMNGRILVKSELGVGTEFTVVLPVLREQPIVWQQQSQETIAALLPGSPALKITPHEQRAEKPLMLIVEDNPDLVKYLVDSFNPAYNLEIAYNGHQGLEKGIRLVPDVIITDVMMPEKNGFELCRELKAHKLTSHIPIIILTARVDTDSRMRGIRRGADAYLEKPFLPEELKTQIRALLEQRKRLQDFYLSQAGLVVTESKEKPTTAEARVENNFLKSVNELIEQQLQKEDFNVEQLARDLFIDPSNLYRKLTALTGIGPSEYIRSFRMAKAKQLLTTTDMPIAAIARECGFANYNYFSRLFKQETGFSPSKYRKQ